MKLKEAIKNADNLRPNALSDEQKASWIYEVEAIISEMKEETMPTNSFPQDSELLMEYPYDNIYELYLSAKIDYANEEFSLYANDMVIYNDALGKAQAWYRRNNKPTNETVWKVM